MLNHLLAYLRKTGILRQIRNITVHFGEHLYILHHLASVRLEAAVHVMQLNTRHFASCGVEEL